jgi:hypothetical protein
MNPPISWDERRRPMSQLGRDAQNFAAIAAIDSMVFPLKKLFFWHRANKKTTPTSID